MNRLIVKSVISIFIVFCFVVPPGDSQGQKSMETRQDEPKVLKAVAPTFYPFVFKKTGLAEVVIEAKVGVDGKVISTQTVSFTHFSDLSIDEAARQWEFEKSLTKSERRVRIKFVF